VVFKNMLEKFDFFSQMKRELEIQWRLDHPNIVKLYGYFYDVDNVYVVLEYAQYGNLYQRLRREKCFSEEKGKLIIAQMVDALLYL
jgi:aurora kinase